jgi:hypothetical protein
MCLTKTILNAMIMFLVLILLRLNSKKELFVFSVVAMNKRELWVHSWRKDIPLL